MIRLRVKETTVYCFRCSTQYTKVYLFIRAQYSPHWCQYYRTQYMFFLQKWWLLYCHHPFNILTWFLFSVMFTKEPLPDIRFERVPYSFWKEMLHGGVKRRKCPITKTRSWLTDREMELPCSVTSDTRQSWAPRWHHGCVLSLQGTQCDFTSWCLPRFC